MTCTHAILSRTPGGCPLCTTPPPPDPVARLADIPPGVWRAVECVQNLATFLREGWHVLEATTPLAWGRHLDTVCAHVQAVIEDWAKRQADPNFAQRIRDLLVTLPPGTLKSRILVYAVPWAWLRWPELRVIALSCNPRVAMRDSSYAREIIASDWYRQTFSPSWTIRRDTDGKELFANSAGGFRAAAGLDARIVGQRGDVLLVDDPHDPEEAESDLIRRGVIDRWDTSVSNRVNDLGSSVRIMVAQRTHEDDLPAHVIAEGWTHVNLPLLFEPEAVTTSPLGTYDWRSSEGECLHPERFTPEVIEAEKRKGEQRFATLYQQRPAPKGGAIVKLDELRFWRRKGDPAMSHPKGCRDAVTELPTRLDGYVIAADLAGGKKTTTGDYNVIVTMGRAGSSFFLLDCWRQRADFPDVLGEFMRQARAYPSAGKFVEQAAAGASLVASLQSQVPGLVAVPPRGDKEGRLHAVHHFFRAGNVHLPEDWPELGVCVQELVTFPRSRHDDFVDALSLAIGQLAFVVMDPAEEEKRRAIIRILLNRKPHLRTKREILEWLNEQLLARYPWAAPARATDFRPDEPIEPEPAAAGLPQVRTPAGKAFWEIDPVTGERVTTRHGRANRPWWML